MPSVSVLRAFQRRCTPERKEINEYRKEQDQRHRPEIEQPDFVKKNDKTTYKINVHFSTTSKETMQDKIIRMLRNEVSQTPKL